MTMNWYMHLLWVVAAGVLGFATAAVFAGALRLPRNWFLVPYTTNPIAAMGSHIAMHIACVLHGPATTAQLPPHYQVPIQVTS